MVRTLNASAFIPDLSPQAAFDRLYAGPEAAQQYHAECNKDPEAKVGPWENGKREVVFGLKAPAALARTVGIKQMTIREVSTREDVGGGAIVIRSEPILEFPGGSNFMTSSVMRMEPKDGGCQMSAEVSCTAAGPWGFIGTIEESMAVQAQNSIDSFLAFCVSWCEPGGVAQEGPAGEPVLQPAALQNSYISPASSMDEAFYDASAMSDASSLSRAGSAGPEVQQLSNRLRAVEAAVRKLEARQQQQQQQQQQQLPVTRFWAVSAVSFAVAAAVVGSVAIVTMDYGRRSAGRSAAAPAWAPAT